MLQIWRIGFLFAILLYWTVIITTEAIINCDDQWNRYSSCVRSTLSGSAGSDGKRIAANDKRRIEQTAIDCFNQNECNNPTPTDAELNTRVDCFEKIRKAIRLDLETCIRKDPKFPEFKLPPDQIGGYDWAFTLSRIQQALKDVPDPSKAMCSGRKHATELFSCLQFGNYNFNQSILQFESSYCSLKNQCNRKDILEDRCQKLWLDHVTPVICSCSTSNDKQLGKHHDDYQSCVRAKGYTVDGGDPGPAFINAQVRFCDICF